MLQFTGGIGLGMDVGDLFQFQRTLQGHGELRTAPEKQGVTLIGKALRQDLNLVVERQGLFNLGR